jgi:hypothetical protein
MAKAPTAVAPMAAPTIAAPMIAEEVCGFTILFMTVIVERGHSTNRSRKRNLQCDAVVRTKLSP